MPYKRKGKCVYKSTSKGSTNDKPLGCSSTPGKAKKYLKALYASEVNESLPSIITPEELKLASSKFMPIFIKGKKTWIDKYGLKKAELVMFKTAIKKAKKELQSPTPINENKFKSSMDKKELRAKIEVLAKQAYAKYNQTEEAAVEYDELTKFPELKKVIVDLLTPEFNNFISTIDWVSPRPTTFRINLKNGYEFYLTYGKRSWIAQIEGKKYYLLNLPEEERAAAAISRILKYGEKEEVEVSETDEFGDVGGELPTEEAPTEEA